VQPGGAPAPAPAAAAAAPLIQRQHPAVLGGAAMLGAVLVLIGQVLLFRPAPQRVVVTTPLTAAQTAALRDAEKLTAVIEKLDKKTRATIAAEMAKP
jgi:hypothetical protein